MERRVPPYDDIHREQRNRVTDPGAQSSDCWNGPSRGDHSRTRRRKLRQRGFYGFYARFHERRWDIRERAVSAIDELGPALRRIGIGFHRRRHGNPRNDAKYFCKRYLPGRAIRLHAFQHNRIHRIGQQPCQWRQYFSVNQRGRALRGVPFFCDELGDGRYEWRRERVCPGHVRGSFVRLHAFHATRFGHDRWSPGQWRDHFSDDRHYRPLHHI